MTTSVRTASMPRSTPFGDGGSQTEPITISLTARATLCFMSARSGREARCSRSSKRRSTRSMAGSKRSSSEVLATPAQCASSCGHDASKWTAIRYLAKLWRIEPQEICAVGDDVNDIPMIRHAGLGVAMGHAGAEVLTAADLITGDHEQDGVAMLVDDVLLA